MKKIFVSILLVLFIMQPLVAQGLTYRNTELNIMMNTKTDAEKENKPVDLSMRSRVVTSIFVGGGVGLLFGLIVAKSKLDATTDSNSPLKALYVLVVAGGNTLLGGIIGGVYGAVTHENPTQKKSDMLKKLDRYDPPKSVDIIKFNQNKKKLVHEQIAIGQTKNEITKLIGNAKTERFLITRSKKNYGAEKEFWHEIEIGTELELWSYDFKKGKLNLYFLKGSNVLKYKAFNPKK